MGWILLGFLGGVAGLAFVYALLKISADAERQITQAPIPTVRPVASFSTPASKGFRRDQPFIYTDAATGERQAQLRRIQR